MLEFYQAWSTYSDLMDLFEELLTGLALAVCGTTQITFGDLDIDFSAPFRRADMDELIAEHAGVERSILQTAESIEAWWRSSRTVADDADLPSSPQVVGELLFDEYVEHNLINPTFVTGFPTEISPLSRRNEDDPSRVDRFEMVVAGWELINAFSELNDPVDQAERFAAQASNRTEDDAQSLYFDKDYIRALTYGMPPTAGAGLGIDRLVMLLTGKQNIREVILFPHFVLKTRPKEHSPRMTDSPKSESRQPAFLEPLDSKDSKGTFAAEWWIAIGHLRSKKRDSSISLVTGLSVIGVVFGVAILTVSLR